ncbi:MAG: hypothetical protein ABSD74_17115 [Rhizomicrobium sp.]|jgi:hypothetical protein
MKLEIKLSTPKGVPEGIDLDALKKQIRAALDISGVNVDEKSQPAGQDKLGFDLACMWIVHHWEDIANAAKTASSVLGSVNILSQVFFRKKAADQTAKEETKKKAPEAAPADAPVMTFAIRDDKGHALVERRLPIAEDELKGLVAEIEQQLRKHIQPVAKG